MSKKLLQTSETREIKRSQISKNPLNPKRHKDDRVKLQAKNLKKVGYLGGIVWNETTGNLIDGHRRISAMDLYYGYDGTVETDYDVKVEVVRMNEQEEKQQLAYMAAGDTKADIDLIANFANEIDLDEIGLSQGEIDDILNIANGATEAVPDLLEELTVKRDERPAKGSAEYEAAKAKVKAAKAMTRDGADESLRDEGAFITLSFSTYENLVAFCDLLGISPSESYAKGEEVMSLID